eukprot:3372504-Amphidinium_carterae.1
MVRLTEEGYPQPQLRVLKTPIPPDASVVAQHKITHLPYQSWCEKCVLGKAQATKHGLQSAVSLQPSRPPTIQ